MASPLVFMDSKDVSCTSFFSEDTDTAHEPSTSFSRETDSLEDNKLTEEDSGATASVDVKPKSIHRAKTWSDEVENLYRFQQAGYRDEIEYKQVKQVDMEAIAKDGDQIWHCFALQKRVERWPETGFVKKLQRRDNTFYYYDKERECEDKEVHKVKVYAY